MNSEAKPKKNWKEKFYREFTEYWINVAYLAIYFAIFINYKRMILAGYNIVYEEYGFAIINALILGKVVSVGGMMRLELLLENKPLIVSTLGKSVIFTIWLAFFNALEIMIRGFVQIHTFQGSLDALSHIGTYEYFGGVLVVFTSFIPFFAFKDLSRVLGTKMVRDLFLKKQPSAQ